jgi:hypothetical protein
LAQAVVAKGGCSRPEPRDGRKSGDLGFSPRPRLCGGKPTPQDFVLGPQGLNGGFEDPHKR